MNPDVPATYVRDAETATDAEIAVAVKIVITIPVFAPTDSVLQKNVPADAVNAYYADNVIVVQMQTATESNAAIAAVATNATHRAIVQKAMNLSHLRYLIIVTEAITAA